jgi:hypothetical protein
MIELLFTFLSVLLYPLIFSYPLNIFNYKNFFSVAKFKFFDLILLNTVIHLFILLIFSIFINSFKVIFFIDFIISILFFFFYFKKYLFFFKKNSILLLFYVILTFSLFVSISYNPLLAWDGIAHWFYKALNYYQGYDYINLKNVPFNYYPHLGSFIWFYFWKNSFLQIEYFGRFFFVFIYLTSIFSLFDYLKSSFNLLEKILLILIFSYFCKDAMLFAGYQEYLIFSLFYIFSRFFLILKNSNIFLDKNYLSLIILVTSFLILWTKQEGFFYYLILNLIFLVHVNHSNSFKLYYFLLSLFLISIFFFIKIHYFGSLRFNETIFTKQLLLNFYPSIFLNKFILILRYTIISFFKYPVWLFIILSSISLYKDNYFSKNKFFVSFFLLTFLLFFAIYFQTNQDITVLLPETLSRLIFQSSGFLLPILIDFFNRSKSN